MRRNFISLLTFLFFAIAGLQAQSYTFQHSSLPCLNKKFTIVAHIFRDSLGAPGVTEDAIKMAVEGMNPFFAPICASFEVCEFRYHDNWEHDFLEDMAVESAQIATEYHADFRINMYFVSGFTDPLGHCGFATVNGISQATSSFIFIRKDCITTRVFTHEMGHFFSLLHTFEGNGNELVNSDNCTTAGDGLCDTPADPFVDGDPQSDYVTGDCLFISPKTDTNGEFYNPDLGNIMSYYECGGLCGFTWEQLNKMAQAYLTSGVKFW